MYSGMYNKTNQRRMYVLYSTLLYMHACMRFNIYVYIYIYIYILYRRQNIYIYIFTYYASRRGRTDERGESESEKKSWYSSLVWSSYCSINFLQDQIHFSLRSMCLYFIIFPFFQTYIYLHLDFKYSSNKRLTWLESNHNNL